MGTYTLFFYSASGFVCGAIAGGVGLALLPAFLTALGGTLLLRILFSLRARLLVTLLITFCAGSLYYTLDDLRYHESMHAAAAGTTFVGSITEEPRVRDAHQVARIHVTEVDGRPVDHLRLSLYLDHTTPVRYGDVVQLHGSVTPPPADSYATYLANHHLAGTLFRPDLIVLEQRPNRALAVLYAFRSSIKARLNAFFTPDHSAFLQGVLLGDRDSFTDGFIEKLSLSGTLHITALSGLHMTIFVFIASSIFLHVTANARRLSFALSFLTIALFVAMTGFKISAVRASLMAGLVHFAREFGHHYDQRNALIFAALVLTLFNPKAPVFDVGFQLSFVATASIIYLAPALMQLRFFQNDGVLAWRSIAAITIAAQIGVLPISIVHFGTFSFSMLPANVALLIILPPLMAGGLATIAASFLSSHLAQLISLPTAFLLDYAHEVIDLFSAAYIPFNPELSALMIIGYYVSMIALAARFSPSLGTFFAYDTPRRTI